MSLPSSPRAVVTGAGSGLGRALCVALAQRGAKVLVSDIDLAGAEATAQAAEQAARRWCSAANVANADEVEALGTLADARFGGSDLIVNNAARALRCCELNQLYCVPMPDARWGWRFKRLAPQHFYRKLMPAVIKQGRST